MECTKLDGYGSTIKFCCETAERRWGRSVGYNLFDNNFVMYETCSKVEQLGNHEAFQIFYCPFCGAKCIPCKEKPKKMKRRL